RLAFRDALRSDPELVAEYQALKLQMIDEEKRGGPEYSAVAKRTFVARVLAQAGIEIPAVSPR
ncbi:MAG: GrpB protein, partial [Gaiellaceae bacterium]|nr:GrpB protein [Gaiellaceae bacterium]